MTDKLYWEPVLADAEYAEHLREDYSHDADMSDDEILDKYCNGRKYVVTWDHVGDAYHDYEKLADAYLELKGQIEDSQIAKDLEKSAKHILSRM